MSLNCYGIVITSESQSRSPLQRIACVNQYKWTIFFNQITPVHKCQNGILEVVTDHGWELVGVRASKCSAKL